jgi:ABC-type microcin C transport system permease subunit YejB
MQMVVYAGFPAALNSLSAAEEVFDEMLFDIPIDFSSLSLLSYAVQPIRLYPTLMSILLCGYEQLSNCISQVEQMSVKAKELEQE